MIIVTGAAGFIGSCISRSLDESGRKDLILVDEFDSGEKWKNLRNLSFSDILDKGQLFDRLKTRGDIEAVIHMGACSSTTERDMGYLLENNYRYTLQLAEYCLHRGVRYIYASSAATYGDGELGYKDDLEQIDRLQPMNPYGCSKQLFDLKARNEGWFDHIAGLKFFNVYGPNEYHKGGMASVVYHAFNQIKKDGEVRLFRSHREGYENGEQLRDFVYVRDCVKIVRYLLDNPKIGGLFNCGTGTARSFKDLALAVFSALNLQPAIQYIDMPEHLRDRYQYYTQATMNQITETGFAFSPTGLEDGVRDYVTRYLNNNYAHYTEE